MIGEELRPIRFSLNTIANFESVTGVEWSSIELKSTMRMDYLRALIWSALKSGAAVDKKPFDFTLEDVGNWIEELGLNGLTEILHVANQSMPKPSRSADAQKKS